MFTFVSEELGFVRSRTIVIRDRFITYISDG